MSQTNDICPKCKKPCSPNHTLIGFDGAVPKLQCNRKPEDGPDPYVEGVSLLWNRMEAAEASASKTGADFDKKTADCKDALARIAVLERENVAQKKAISDFQGRLAKADSDKEAAVNEAVLKTEKDLGAELKKAQADLEKLDNDFSEKLRFKEQRLGEAEAENAKLRGKIDEITASLVSAHARADAAEAKAADAAARVEPLERANAVLQKNGLKQARANLELVSAIGDLKGRVDELALVCKDNGLPVSEIVFEIETMKPEQVEAETDVVMLDQMKKPDVAARKVPPPPPAASAAASPAVVSPLPAAPPPAPAPIAAPLTGPVCMCCDTPTRATKVAKDKWILNNGTYVEPLYTCKKLVAHANDFYAVLDAYRDQLANPPDDPSELLAEFEDINPNA